MSNINVILNPYCIFDRQNFVVGHVSSFASYFKAIALWDTFVSTQKINFALKTAETSCNALKRG